MKTYVCVCGRTFDNPQKFNGHKQGCSEHIINKYGSVEAFNLIKNRNHNKGEIVHNRYLNKKKEELANWVLEKHTCEKCGKVMTEYYGTGRFCSQNCANSKSVSVETKQKISTTIRESEIFKKSVLLKRERARSSYYENPHSCCICGTLIPFEHKNNKTCSKECARKLQSNTMIKKYSGGITHTTVRHRYKFGTYRGISCDSSWELAFVLYHLDHKLEFIRNTSDSFTYEYKGHLHKFFPDFIIDNEYYEIKNFPSDLTEAKISYFPKTKKLHVLYYNDVKPYIKYAVDAYGKDYYQLYDRNYPSWMDTSNI